MAAIAILVTSCGSGQNGSGASSPSSSAPTVSAISGSLAFGHPSPPSAADRTLDIQALDTLRFDPESISVKTGETVTFRIHDRGVLRHQFVLATPADQQTYELNTSQALAAANAIVVQAGQTKALTWTFTTPGHVVYGCHEPGHFAAGMKGTIIVS